MVWAKGCRRVCFNLQCFFLCTPEASAVCLWKSSCFSRLGGPGECFRISTLDLVFCLRGFWETSHRPSCFICFKALREATSEAPGLLQLAWRCSWARPERWVTCMFQAAGTRLWLSPGPALEMGRKQNQSHWFHFDVCLHRRQMFLETLYF